MPDLLGRAHSAPRDPSQDRRGQAIDHFMFVMQYRRDLREARDLLAQTYPGNETRIDADIAQANAALRAAVIELEASRLS